MRSVVILALVLGCSHESPPTGRWCQTYVDALRTRAKDDAQAMTGGDANRRLAVERLRAMVGPDPALELAFTVCSDAAGDPAARKTTRQQRIADAKKAAADFLALHGETSFDAAKSKQLEQLFEQLATAYSDPAPQ